ncbi:hypothetical protein ACFY94_38135 [Streptomyces griseorubiginosus]
MTTAPRVLACVLLAAVAGCGPADESSGAAEAVAVGDTPAAARLMEVG